MTESAVTSIDFENDSVPESIPAGVATRPVPWDTWTWARPSGRVLSAAVGAGALAAAVAMGGALQWTFWVGLLGPDLAVVARIARDRSLKEVAEDGNWGESAIQWYNVLHDVRGPLATLGLGVLTPNHALVVGGLGWLAHIAIDRAVGFGKRHSDSSVIK